MILSHTIPHHESISILCTNRATTLRTRPLGSGIWYANHAARMMWCGCKHQQITYYGWWWWSATMCVICLISPWLIRSNFSSPLKIPTYNAPQHRELSPYSQIRESFGSPPPLVQPAGVVTTVPSVSCVNTLISVTLDKFFYLSLFVITAKKRS